MDRAVSARARDGRQADYVNLTGDVLPTCFCAGWTTSASHLTLVEGGRLDLLLPKTSLQAFLWTLLYIWETSCD